MYFDRDRFAELLRDRERNAEEIGRILLLVCEGKAARSWIGDEESRRDAVQAAVLKLWELLPRVQPDRGAFGYLTTAAYHEMLKESLRQQKQLPRHVARGQVANRENVMPAMPTASRRKPLPASKRAT